jgi:hypothetical protein
MINQPDGRQHQGQGEEPCQELAHQQRVAVDRLRQHPRHGAPVELAVYRVEGQGDGNQRHQEAQEAHKGRQRLAGEW